MKRTTPDHGSTCTEYTLTKWEAALIARVSTQFPLGFMPDELAASLGWPRRLVDEALETCAAFGLMKSPDQREQPRGVPARRGERVRITDLLTPEQMEMAKGEKHFECLEALLVGGEAPGAGC